MVDAVVHIQIKPPWLTEQDFVLRWVSAGSMNSEILLGVRLCVHNHAQEKADAYLAFHQPADRQLWSQFLHRMTEETKRGLTSDKISEETSQENVTAWTAGVISKMSSSI